jgi:subtilase family serine protease
MLCSHRLPGCLLLYIGAFLALMLPLAACGGSNPQTARPTPTPNPSMAMVPFDLGIPKDAMNAQVVGNLPATTRLHAIISFKSNDTLLNQLSKQQVQSGKNQDLSSLANQLGINDQQYQQIKQYFGVQGASLQLSKLHTNLTIDAPASTFASLLHTQFVYRQYKGRKFFAPVSTLQLPLAIADHITAISGLDNYGQPMHPAIALSPLSPLSSRQAHGKAQASCSDQFNNVITLQQLRHAYGFDRLYSQGWSGRGATIILGELGAFNTHDVQLYMSCAGFNGRVSFVNVDNVPPTDTTGPWSEEATMDLELVIGLAPNANIMVYQTAQDLEDANGDPVDSLHEILQQIIQDNTNNQTAKVVSLSMGTAEQLETSSDVDTLSNDMKILTQGEHITVFASSGDCGAYAEAYDPMGDPNRLDVNYPASDPDVVGVGGTLMQTDATGTRLDETVWSPRPRTATCENSWGSGGGLSSFFQRSNWQMGNGVLNNQYVNNNPNDGRQVPDVAAAADKMLMIYDNQWRYAGGTSAAAPIWATGFELINTGLISTTRYYLAGPAILYNAANHSGNLQPFYNVDQGNNLYYTATPGWNFCTGLGTPNLSALYQVFYNIIKASVSNG